MIVTFCKVMQTREIISSDGLRLHLCQWEIDNCENGKTIVLIHGLGEHIGRYKHVASFFNRNGWNVYGYDQRGHGKSEGKRGHTPDLEFNLDDLKRVIESIESDTVVVYGHSFGGNVLANFLLSEKHREFINSHISAAVLSNPWLQLYNKPQWIERSLAKFVSNFVPSFTQSSKIDATELSYLPEVATEYLNDPLNHDRISVRLFSHFFNAGLRAIKNSGRLSVNTLVFHGEDDKIISPEGSKEFAKNAGEKATLKLYPNTKHEPHNDQSSCAILTDVNNWLNKQ